MRPPSPGDLDAKPCSKVEEFIPEENQRVGVIVGGAYSEAIVPDVEGESFVRIVDGAWL